VLHTYIDRCTLVQFKVIAVHLDEDGLFISFVTVPWPPGDSAPTPRVPGAPDNGRHWFWGPGTGDLFQGAHLLPVYRVLR